MKRGGMRSLSLTLLTQLAGYRRRFWEPLLIVVAIFIASAGLTTVTLINAGASSQLAQFTIGDIPVNWQITSKRKASPLTQADYATLRRDGFDYLVAYARSENGKLWMDQLALISLLPAGQTASGLSFSQLAAHTGIQDINQYYDGDVTPDSDPLSGLAIVAEVTPEIKQKITAVLPAHLRIERLMLAQSNNNLQDSFSLNLWAMGALMALVSVFIVFNALNLLLAARAPVLVKLRQLGISQRVLLLGLQLEMLVLALFATVGGVLAGTSLVAALTPVLSNIYRFLLDGQFSNGQFSLFRLLCYAGLLCFIAVTVMGFLINQRLSRCLANRSSQVAAYYQRYSGGYHYWLLPVLVMVALGASLISSQLQALLYIGLVLVAGCTSIVLFMPPLMRLVAKQMSSRYPVLHWSMHNAVALSQRTKLAACAFFIALAANVGMNVMVDSFRQATEQWLEQRLFAPFYIYTDFAGDLSVQEGAPVTLLARYGKDIRLDGQTIELRSFPDSADFQQHLMLDSVVNDAWPAFYKHRGVFINQQLAYRQGLRPGDTVDLPVGNDEQNMSVLGIYPDYGNPKAQLLLPEHRLATDYERISAYAVFADSAQAPELKAWLAQHDKNARLIPTTTLIEQSMSVFSRTFLTTDSLNLVTMLVAALSFFVSITLLVMDIKPQLMLLRSVGVSPWRIKLSLFFQYVSIALSCALLALPFALLLAWLLVNKVNRFAFGWTYPLLLDPLIIAQSVLLGLGVLIILMALPVGRLEAKFNSHQEAL